MGLIAMLWCLVSPDRIEKSRRIIEPLCEGFGDDASIIEGEPPDNADPFVIYGQMGPHFGALGRAYREARPFFQVDNGYYLPGRGTTEGYYRICYRSLWPVLLLDPSFDRVAGKLAPTMKPWRQGDKGQHVVIAEPGAGFGSAIGMDMKPWIASAYSEVRKITKRRITVRPKRSTLPLTDELANAWALVTHSSNVAVDAVLMGVPVFVAPTSPAFPVGNTSLAAMETPKMPDRTKWWASLMCQQFTVGEMRDGTAWGWMRKVVKQVDGHVPSWGTKGLG